METGEQLDADISDLHARIATLHAHRANLAAVLLSQPHLAARLAARPQHDKAAKTARDVLTQQSHRNLENIYRACAGVTAFKVKDPDPHAVNNGNILGVSIDVSVRGKFVETYHVLLNWKEKGGEKLLQIHKHTVPPCIPLQQLATKWLPIGSKDVEGAVDPEQDLVRFGRGLRKELVGWHTRVRAVEDLRKEAGLSSAPIQHDEQGATLGATSRVLNAFVSDDDASSDIEEPEEEDATVRITDITADAAVRQITVSWSDRRTAIMTVTKDGRIEKAICRARNGSRDVSLGRKAFGPIGGLVRRLVA